MMLLALFSVAVVCVTIPISANHIPANWRDFIDPDILANSNAEVPRYDSSLPEGDILGVDSLADLLGNREANAIDEASSFWPNNTIPYELPHQSSAISEKEMQIILESMGIISFLTGNCIKFVERTTEEDYISFQKGIFCASEVGRKGGKQNVSYARECLFHHGDVQHELMHVMGFYHEHSRGDRDDYIIINWDNIRDTDRAQFEKHASGNTYGLPYDYESIMHYAFNAFAKDSSTPTIVPKVKNSKIGQNTNLSPLDVARIHRRFRCKTFMPNSFAGTQVQWTAHSSESGSSTTTSASTAKLFKETPRTGLQQASSHSVDQDRRWPNGIVPYGLSASFGLEERMAMLNAMHDFTAKTSIKFRIKTDSDTDYIYVVRGFFCQSVVGRQGGEQHIVLSPSCMKSGLIQHELMHALGFQHENSRLDRDQYVEINWSNIDKSDRRQFAMYHVNTFGLPYDFASIMHFGSNSFAIDNSVWTMLPRKNVSDTAGASRMGQREGLSELDIQRVKLAYPIRPGCPAGLGWKELMSACYFFSFLADGKPKLTYAEAQTFCRQKDAEIPAEPNADVANLLSVLISPWLPSDERIYISGCQTISAEDVNRITQDTCDDKLLFICKR